MLTDGREEMRGPGGREGGREEGGREEKRLGRAPVCLDTQRVGGRKGGRAYVANGINEGEVGKSSIDATHEFFLGDSDQLFGAQVYGGGRKERRKGGGKDGVFEGSGETGKEGGKVGREDLR